ncbi:nucleotide sugar dehydrogenase [Salinicoccus luteus]|uniref:nucleotide sugar dehydrogenase n=1 Tax=Salinicoccus luteus TaxID=367840 RepID=UPI0004E0FD80|nr:nucleotide sugar dehydrogenase [Salinicoccus luteus]
MNLYEKIKAKEEKISVVGLGYVGMPLAVSFAKLTSVIGFDISQEKVQKYIDGFDVTNEVGNEAIRNTTVNFTADENKLKECKFHIVAVPTPINQDKTPNLTPVIEATKLVARNMTKGSVIVFESTVYPGVTEEICIPVLENESGLKYLKDFKVGYSPERINPGDKVHKLESIVKVVSGSDEETLETIAQIYELIIEAGVHRAESIKVAEAAKVIENSQRDINIAFMNELSIVFNEMGIDTKSVLEAASTKWNFLNFSPGLVGGHCIGVDPYYFIYKAEELGYHSQIILSGRKINDDMGKHVADNLIKRMIKANINIKNARVGILGIAFKENCPDVRNTKVTDVIEELEEYGVNTIVVDPLVDSQEVNKEYGINLARFEEVSDLDAVILAVPHSYFTEMNLVDLKSLYRTPIATAVHTTTPSLFHENKNFTENSLVLADLKGVFSKNEAENLGYSYWRL